jgi:alkanesulfonate monooxygenase SsuD/methylene tetrahydromethanopterin reductase-like flavin-dependent oxidoreductase (luciferase family)
LQVPRFTWPDAPDSIGPKLAEIARTADEAGFASLWLMDQVHLGHSSASEGMNDAVTVVYDGSLHVPISPLR